MDIKKELSELIVYLTAVNEETLLSDEGWKYMGIDSLDVLEIMLAVSNKFNITINVEDEEKLLNFGLLLAYIENKINTVDTSEET